MKYLVVLAVLCLAHLSLQVPFLENCPESFEQKYPKESCVHLTCDSFKNETHSYEKMDFESCPYPRCPRGERIVEVKQGDKSLAYPECCYKAVCEPVKPLEPQQNDKPSEEPNAQPQSYFFKPQLY